MPSTITQEEFLAKSGADDLIRDFRKKLETENRSLAVSDVRDEQGHQYVDLVQEGGGVLGIALVGYTYVLEKMGIRFFSLAGTSAGSINAMLLACSGNKEDEKSSKVVKQLAELEMFSFVDGKPGNWRFTRWVKKWIQKMLLGGAVFKRLRILFMATAGLWLLCTLACFVYCFINPVVAKCLGIAAGALFLLGGFITLFFYRRFKLFARTGYGLNSGTVFHNWINGILETCPIEGNLRNGTICTLEDFSKHFMRIPPLTVIPDDRRTNNQPPYMPMLTIITCDIVSERKIEFPRMWDLYWSHPSQVRPGDFVRASMSIPVFFESFQVKNIRANSTFAAWDEHLNWQNERKAIPDTAQFIDGGILSNFPISMFYNPNYPVPRMPTFGIRLQDGVLDHAERSNNTFWSYIASLFSTIRFNFDRDFMTRNKAYNRAIKSIDVRGYSWLNFFMTDDDKIALFRKGAEAAVSFLNAFDWEAYKAERLSNFEQARERFDNPNNLEVYPFSANTYPQQET